MEPDITHCSWLHRQAVERCDTEFYKPLDYDDQLLPTYLERAVETLDRTGVHVYGCLLMTLEKGQFSPRWWPNKPLETMWSGNSNDNQLPHSSVLMRAEMCRKAGNYNERAVGLGADDYHLWNRIHQAGGKFVRDDEVRNVVYRIHEKNSLKIRKARYGAPPAPQGMSAGGKLVAGAAAASIAIMAAPSLDSAKAAPTEMHAAPHFPAQPTQSAAGKSTDPRDPARPAARGPGGAVSRWLSQRLDSAKATLRKLGHFADDRKPDGSKDDRQAVAATANPHHDVLVPPHS
jgi:hypothetical protein